MPASHSPVALVSGAGSGIGLAVARRLWSEGFRVLLVGRSKAKLESAAREAPTGMARAFACDVADAASVAALKSALEREASDWLSALDVLVNNAGIYEPADTLTSDDDNWERQFQTNLMGSVRLARLCVPGMRERKRGAVVNVASTLGLKPIASAAAYSASKAAMVNWTQSLALECAPDRVCVNCVAPGLVETPIHPSFYGRSDAEGERIRTQMNTMQPLLRVGTPEEIAEAVFYFCRPLSSWTTGATLSVDGGIGLA